MAGSAMSARSFSSLEGGGLHLAALAADGVPFGDIGIMLLKRVGKHMPAGFHFQPHAQRVVEPRATGAVVGPAGGAAAHPHIVGDETQIIVVNVQAPRGWVPEVNAILARFAQQYRGVELANWYDAIQPSLDVLASDEVHPGGPIGGQIYAGAIRDALQRLAELPPLRDENDRGLAPRPI